ncbi:restriction endonuclease subunit S [Polaribacter sp. Z014]|uniref:restriction endonuclease subunit S n=1 Tax=Polaribacter sp. Z014 TaxID=2927126 RepID=UPI0020205668|nr:restriction endonuclease subunit S [Polaribacter sp. Z014]MCL7763169.1 restriction endonuclease subunit S [Polaribacter sp. Z014]
MIDIEIGQIGQTITGKTPSSKFPEDFGEEYMFITPSDNFDDKTIYRTNRYLSENGLNKLKNKILPPKSVLVSCIGSAMGKVTINNSTAITNQQINSIIVNSNYYDSDYIYYQLKNNYKLLRTAALGSTALPMLNKTEFDKLKLSIHKNLVCQKKIAKVLSDLDAKIEINNKINQELEAMAKTLYDYWFVQFDFPVALATSSELDSEPLTSGNSKPYKSSGGKMVFNDELKREIPVGWESGTFDTISTITGGSTPSKAIIENFTKENNTSWITPKDLSQNKGKKFITRGEWDVTNIGIKSASLKLMPKGTVLLSSRAPIGYLAISRQEVTTNQGFKSFVPKENYSSEFIYYSVKNQIPKIEAYSSGSTFKEVSTSTLRTLMISIPNENVLEEYYKISKPIFKKQNLLELENQKLSELRDWLLPMLMNGQITVGGAEKAVSSLRGTKQS